MLLVESVNILIAISVLLGHSTLRAGSSVPKKSELFCVTFDTSIIWEVRVYLYIKKLHVYIYLNKLGYDFV